MIRYAQNCNYQDLQQDYHEDQTTLTTNQI